jgi:hypothetical protein
MASADGSILIRTKVDTSGVKSGTKQIESGLSGIGASVAKLGLAMATVFSVQKLVQFGKQAIKTSSEMANAMIGLKSIVDGTGNSFDQATSFINDYISDGLVPATNAITAYKNLLMRGYTTEQIEKVMTALKDSSAFGRQSTLSLGDAVQGATEGLKNENSMLVDNAGVTKNVAKMWEDYAKSIGTTANALTKEQKIQAEVNGIMTETRFQTGDAAKVANTWSGQISMLNAKWQQFMVIVGSGLIKALTPVVKVLNSILTSVISVGNAIAKVFGWETSIESTTASTVSNLSDTVASQEELGSSASDTNKALKKQLAFFDDINVLASETASSGSGSGGIGGTGTGTIVSGVTKDDTKELTTFEKTMRRIFDLFKEGFDIGFKTDKLFDLGKNIEEIRKALIDIWSNPDLQKSIKKFVESTIKTLGTVAGAMSSISISIGYGITGGIKDAVTNANFQKFVSKKLSGVFDSLTGITKNVSDLAEAFAEIGLAFEAEGFQKIISFFIKLGTFVDLTILDRVVGFFGDISKYLSAPITGNGEKWSKLLENIFTIIGNLLEPMSQFLDLIMGDSKNYDETTLHSFIQDMSEFSTKNWGKALDNANTFLGVIANLSSFTQKVDFTKPFVDMENWINKKKDIVRQWFTMNVEPWFSRDRWYAIARGMLEGINQKWNEFLSWWNDSAIGQWFNNNVAPWFRFDRWYSLASGMYYGISQKWNEFVWWWNNSAVGSWFNNNVAPWFSTSKWQQLGENMKNGLYNGVKGVVGNIVGVMNKIIDTVESMVNKVIDAVNVMIGGAISLAGKVNLKLGINKLSRVNIGNIGIPALAKGGVIPPNSEFMAVLGDQKSGLNIETPLQTMIDAFNTALNGRSGGGSNQVTLNIDGQTFARLTLDSYFSEMKRQGYDVAMIGG